MPVAVVQKVFLGTSESTGITIANNATSTSSEIDVLGNDTTEGRIRVFLKYTGTVAAGSIQVTFYPSRVTGQPYAAQAPVNFTVNPINGTQSIFLGDLMTSRYMTATVFNNAVGASLTNVFLAVQAIQES